MGSSCSDARSSIWIEPGDELVVETFARLIERKEVVAYPYEGFCGPMDTIKDRQRLESLHESGRPPWLVHPQDEPRPRRLTHPLHLAVEDRCAGSSPSGATPTTSRSAAGRRFSP